MLPLSETSQNVLQTVSDCPQSLKTSQQNDRLLEDAQKQPTKDTVSFSQESMKPLSELSESTKNTLEMFSKSTQMSVNWNQVLTAYSRASEQSE